MASPSSTVELIDLVRKSGIYRGENLDERLQDVPGLSGDPVQSAAVLVQHGLLTRFQAKLLLTGRYKGFRLGAYVIREQIGQGGMGAVYLAEHETLRRKVAIKVLTPPKDDVNGKLTVERFLREARAAAALDHPNIVRIHDVAQQGEVHYLVMEYVDGQTLDQLLEKGGPITPSRAVAYIAQAAAGLQHAHEKGFVHRDVKPANLILAKDGTVKILDMGLARSFTAENDKLTEVMDQGAILGTADFISPEQAMNAPGIDIRADVYSLGATFFALVTGKPPFSGNTTQKLIQHQMKDAPDLTSLDRTFPPELSAVASRMLHKKPEKRYQSPAEVINALAPWLNEDGGTKVMAGISGTDMGNTGELQTAITEIVGGNKTRRVGSRRMTAAQKRWSGRLVLFGVALPVTLAFILFGYVIFFSESEKDKALKKAAAQNSNPNAVEGGGAAIKTSSSNPKSAPKAAPKSGTTKSAPPRATRPVSASRPTGKAVFKFDPASIPEFQFSLRGSTVTAGSRPEYPSWFNLHCWKPDTVGDFNRTVVDDKPVLGLVNRDGEATTQFAIDLTAPDANFSLAPDGEYTFRVEYLTRNGANGTVFIQNKNKDWAALANEVLADTGGQWQTVTGKFRRDKSDPVQFAINAHNSSDGMLYIRSIQVIDPNALADAPSLLKLDFAALKPEVVEVRRARKFGDSFGRQTLPRGWGLNHFDDGSDADYAIADVGGARAFGLKNVGGQAVGTQVIFDSKEGWDKVPTGETVVFRIAYQYEGPGAGQAQVQLQQEPWTKQTTVELPPTGGAWQNVEIAFTRPDDSPYSLIFNLGNHSGGAIWIKSLEAFLGEAPAAAAAGSQVGAASPTPVYSLDLANQQPFVMRAKAPLDPAGGPRKLLLVNQQGGGKLPTSWYRWVESPDAEAEFFADTTGGKSAIGVRMAGGPGGALLSSPEFKVPAGKSRVAVEYQTGPASRGAAIRFRPTKADVKTTWELIALAPTGGAWKTEVVETDFRGAAGGLLELYNASPGLEAAVRISTLSVGPAGGVAAADPGLIYRLDLSAQKPFAKKGTVQKRDGQTVDVEFVEQEKTGDGDIPAGWVAAPWDQEAEFLAEVHAEAMALGIRHAGTGRPSGMLFTPDLSFPSGKAVVHMEYLTDGTVGGVFKFKQSQPSVKTAWNIKQLSDGTHDLPGTNGKWESVQVEVDLQGATGGYFEFHNNDANRSRGFWLRALEIRDPAAGAPAAAAPVPAPVRELGPPVYAFEAGALPPGKYTVENQKNTGDNFFPAGFLGHCWKAESVAEFRSGEAAGSRAFGVTNLNDNLSSQVIVGLEGTLGVTLAQGKEYRVRVEYRAANDAEGKVEIREPGPSYKGLGNATLARGTDAWKSAEFTFRKDSDKKLDLLIENTAVGEGNTLWVRKFEIFEVK